MIILIAPREGPKVVRMGNDASFTKDFEVNSFLVNPQKKLGLYSLLNLLQDTAWAHANRLGHSHHETLEKQGFWVLTRQVVEMSLWPDWGQSIRIRTGLRRASPPFILRDFEILLDNQRIGFSTTSWLLLDAASRRPLRVDAASLGLEPTQDFQLDIEPTKIEPASELEDLAQFQVRNSDLDMNEHVNNTRYAQWILDAVPREWHRQYRLKKYEINFLAETKQGESIAIQKGQKMTELVLEGAQGSSTYFQGWREADQKVVFAARLTVV